MPRKQATQATGFVGAIKKFFLSAFVIVSFVAYLFHERQTNSSNANASNIGVTTQVVPTVVSGNIAPTQTGTSATSAGLYKNGTYAGPEVNAYYGLVQVQVVIQNGRIADVQFLDYPHDRRTSQEINAQVMPWLTQEAIQAQSANVDVISGATLTSEAFVNSLQTALQSAKN